MRLVGVKFFRGLRVHYFQVRDLEFDKGDLVVVNTENGNNIGMVIIPPKEERMGLLKRSFREVIREATVEDREAMERLREQEKEAFELCQGLIHDLELEIKLVDVEYLFDGSKVIFYFTSEHRVDFRELVRRLAAQLKMRIEMRQIGVRDEAKMIGGVGCCGHALCCATFLKDFELVSIKMAKDQNLPLNPAKISGQCGRLMCCLSFEVETYQELKKNLPKVGKKIVTKYGEGKVIRQNLLLQTITLELESGGIITIKPEELGK